MPAYLIGEHERAAQDYAKVCSVLEHASELSFRKSGVRKKSLKMNLAMPNLKPPAVKRCEQASFGQRKSFTEIQHLETSLDTVPRLAKRLSVGSIR
jgi:hypothetical protein